MINFAKVRWLLNKYKKGSTISPSFSSFSVFVVEGLSGSHTRRCLGPPAARLHYRELFPVVDVSGKTSFIKCHAASAPGATGFAFCSPLRALPSRALCPAPPLLIFSAATATAFDARAEGRSLAVAGKIGERGGEGCCTAGDVAGGSPKDMQGLWRGATQEKHRLCGGVFSASGQGARKAGGTNS